MKLNKMHGVTPSGSGSKTETEAQNQKTKRNKGKLTTIIRRLYYRVI